MRQFNAMKKFFLLVGCVMVSLISMGLSAPVYANLATDIQSILHSTQTIRGEFYQTKKLVGIPKTLKSNGHFIVDQERGVLWQSVKPFNTTTLIKRGELVQKSEGRVLMSLSASQEPAIKSITSILFATLAGDFIALEKIFTLDGVIRADKTWQVTLFPKDNAVKNLIQTIQLTGSTVVDSAQLKMRNGDTTNIVFKNIEDISLTREQYLGEFN